MLSMSRRGLVLGALSSGIVARLGIPEGMAQVLPEDSRFLCEIALPGRRIGEIAVFADSSFALSLVDMRKSFSRIIARYDARGMLLWRTELEEDERMKTLRAIVPTVGDAQPGLYASSGFKKIWRLAADGSLLWERDLFDYVGMNCPQAMTAHPSGGVLVGGIAHRPTETTVGCANCAVVRLAKDGSPLWVWWRDHAWHAFATTIAVTDQGTVIVHMMSYNQTTGSAGDACEGPSHPQWTVWIGPGGRTIRAQPWPLHRRAEAMALDRAGRLLFYGRTRPELRHFFQVCDAETGTVLYEHVFGKEEPDSSERKWYLPRPRPMDVTDRGTSVALASGCTEPEARLGTDIYTLTPSGPLETAFLNDFCWYRSQVVLPDGRAMLVANDKFVIRIPLP